MKKIGPNNKVLYMFEKIRIFFKKGVKKVNYRDSLVIDQGISIVNF